jgi:hypothetical protein
VNGTEIYEKDGSERYEAGQYGAKLPELTEDPRSPVELFTENVFQHEEGKTLKKG